MHFDGQTYDASKDLLRLKSQLSRVRAVMEDGEWRTLHELSATVRGSQASVSARLRDLRKPKFGGYLVQRRRSKTNDGLWEYRFSLEPGEQGESHAVRLTPTAMKAAIAVLRKVYSTLDPEEKKAIGQLGKWLGACLGEDVKPALEKPHV